MLMANITRSLNICKSTFDSTLEYEYCDEIDMKNVIFWLLEIEIGFKIHCKESICIGKKIQQSMGN